MQWHYQLASSMQRAFPFGFILKKPTCSYYKLILVKADGNSRNFSLFTTLAYIDYFHRYSIGLHSVVDITVVFESIWPGFESWRPHTFLMFFYVFFFCHYYYSANSTLQSLLRFSYFIIPYDAQASSACSALFKFCSRLLKQLDDTADVHIP